MGLSAITYKIKNWFSHSKVDNGGYTDRMDIA
jgi:hypothetical protein